MSKREFEDNGISEDSAALVKKFENMLHQDNSVFIDKRDFNQIIDFYEARFDYANALKATYIAIEQHPFSSSFHLRNGQLKYEANQFNEALEAVRKAKVLDGQNSDIFLLESEILCELNNSKQALEVLNELLEFVDAEIIPDIYLAIADVYELQEQDELEMQFVKMALVMDPDHEEALGRIIDMIEDEVEYLDAIDFHEKLINESPYSYLAWNNLGECYYELKQYRKAIDAFSYVMVIKEDFEPAIRQSAECFYELDLFEKAIELYRECGKLKEDDEYLLYSIGLSYYQLDNMERASYHLNKCLDLDEDFSDGHFYLGKIFEKTGRLTKAEHYMEVASELEEDNEDYIQSLCDLKFTLGKTDEGLNLQRNLTDLNPESLDYWRALINRYIQFEMNVEAYTTAELSLDHFPDNAEILFILGICAVLVGRQKEALDWALRSSSLDTMAFQILKKMDSSLLANPDIKAIIVPFVN